jgi:hypothetical protein
VDEEQKERFPLSGSDRWSPNGEKVPCHTVATRQLESLLPLLRRARVDSMMLGPPDLRPGDGARDDSTLDLASALENRVDSETTLKIPGQGFFPI